MTLTFSVITPSYNQGQFIERTIQSVLSQDGVVLEYLVCDGGSSDQTIDVLRQYQHRLRWVSEPDGGQADAVNKGIEQTTGDIIAWLNSDDVYYPAALSRVQHIFETHPEVQVVYGDAYHIDENDGVIELYPTASWDYQTLKEVCFLCQPATFFRRQLVEKHGLLDISLKFCMDYELWLRYGKITNFFYLPQVLAGSRLYQDTKTLGQRVAVHYEINEMMVSKFTFSPEKWVLAYASVLVEDRDKAEGRDPTDLGVQVQRTNEFFLEAFRGYQRCVG
ncbi:MAG: glycosyltransferase [Leptolyngbyaceae cyanobacterium SM2_5_2]|nr:glycosyltransferase [Leptolyngbyaceae cyanobacterium SM2_5_2]